MPNVININHHSSRKTVSKPDDKPSSKTSPVISGLIDDVLFDMITKKSETAPTWDLVGKMFTYIIKTNKTKFTYKELGEEFKISKESIQDVLGHVNEKLAAKGLRLKGLNQSTIVLYSVDNKQPNRSKIKVTEKGKQLDEIDLLLSNVTVISTKFTNLVSSFTREMKEITSSLEGIRNRIKTLKNM